MMKQALLYNSTSNNVRGRGSGELIREKFNWLTKIE